MLDSWVVCTKGIGKLYENGTPSRLDTHFETYAVGILKSTEGDESVVWLIGADETWAIPSQDVKPVDVEQTGDRFAEKICNVCHCLKPVTKFSPNQNNKTGIVRRPSCTSCRTGIDKRPPKSGQAKRMEKLRPKKGDYFKCPICQKRTIASITASVVADHDHHTGHIRDFICDSCNTGLGRFKNGENYLMNAIAYLKKGDILD